MTDCDRLSQALASYLQPLAPEEFERRLRLPRSQEELESDRALVAWFCRRYPTPRERLAYVRRKTRQWRRQAKQEAGQSHVVASPHK